MPWFIYKFPEDPFEPSSYYLVKGIPVSDGTSTLSAIYTTVEPSTIPATPVISSTLVEAIGLALNGHVSPGVTLLRSNQ